MNNLSEAKEFTSRYQSLMNHYGLEKERIQARQANENGDVESSHRHFKEAVGQAMMLRGSRDFQSREEYSKFLTDLVRQRNLGREIRTQSERLKLRALPIRRLESWRSVRVRVGVGSILKVDRNTYSVPSRLIGEYVDVRVSAEELEVWYGGTLMDRFPRLTACRSPFIAPSTAFRHRLSGSAPSPTGEKIVDLNACWSELQEAVNTANWGIAIERADALLEWLVKKNGFPPNDFGETSF